MKLSGFYSSLAFLLTLYSSMCLAETPETTIVERERIINSKIVDVGDKCVSRSNSIIVNFYVRLDLLVESYLVKVTRHGALSGWAKSEDIIAGSQRLYSRIVDNPQQYYDLANCEQGRIIMTKGLQK